ncbi:MAG: condensation domain-containing protein [Alphaproteobacteria bacterium]|nr:condensation domain-containing protein [Alphaproteobacteria bacterium]
MEVAIVGMACRLPGCPDFRTFWHRLLAGEECLTRFGRDEMAADGVPRRILDDPAYVPVAGFLADADKFDAAFFNVTPAEAQRIDPQQRLLLETAYHALADAGYSPARLPGPVSVYAGTGANAHFWRDIEHAAGDPGRQFLSYVANDKDFAATRIAYKLGLKGAAVTVQTACSTALVGIHLACQNLMLGESDLALAGACSLRLPRRSGYLYEPDGIEAPDGHCRPFDDRAAGTVFSDGAAVLALRRLEDALADGDRIHAVIRGAAVNNDGADKLGFTAPSEAGQIGVVAEAMAVAGVDLGDLSFIEAHGTGTALGDAVEIGALGAVFSGSGRTAACPIGSVKANIGHTDTVAGAAGLIKAALALRNGVLPPQINFDAPNPALRLTERGFTVSRASLPLAPSGLAGISSFGVGGSNAHVVIEGPPSRPHPARRKGRRLFLAAAADTTALDRRMESLKGIVPRTEQELDDVAYTLRRTEIDLPARAFQTAAGEEAPFSGAAPLKRRMLTAGTPIRILLMPGQGAQYPAMGRGLYDAFAVYRETIDDAAAELLPLLGRDLRSILFEGDDDDLAQTALTQPLVFATDVACARLLHHFGIAPDILIGHSLGEYAAACVAGVFGFADGLRLVARRGALMQALPRGRMLAAAADQDTVSLHLAEAVDVAALNAPESTVVSGPVEAVDRAEAALRAAGIECHPLSTSHAFHSAMMEPMLDAFREAVAGIDLLPPQVPILSNLTGALLTDTEATDPDYWCRQLRAPVRFAEGIGAALRYPDPILIESGPGRVLSTLARQNPSMTEGTVTMALMRHPLDRREDVDVLLETLGEVWVAGADIDWTPLDPPGTAMVADLPPYPFAPTRHWLDPAPSAQPEPELPELLVPSWRRVGGIRSKHDRLEGTWLVEDAGGDLASAITAAIERRGAVALPVPRDDLPTRIEPDVRGLVLTASDTGTAGMIAAIARRLDEIQSDTPLTVAWLATGLFDVTGTETLAAEAAPAIGALRCLPLENPATTCLLADCDDPRTATEILADDLATVDRDPIVAYRTGRRWLPSVETLAACGGRSPRIDGPVLITGGHGRVGRLFADAVDLHTADAPVDIYLLSRSGGPQGEGGGRIHHLTGDVGDSGSLAAALRLIMERHGRIACVIHAAGTLDPSGFGPLSGDLKRTAAVHAAAKIDGTKALVEGLAGVDLDFCLLVSSISTWLGGIGYGAYAGANAVLDAIAADQVRRGHPWLSVALDAVAKTDGPPDDQDLSRDDALRAFSRLLTAVLDGLRGEILISATPFAPRLEKWRAAATRSKAQGAIARADTVPGQTPPSLERLWDEVLGLDDAGTNENFFELGGSSLLALQLLSRVRRSVGVEISLADFLAAPTLAGLRKTVSRGAEAAPTDIGIADRSSALPVLAGQRRIWIAEQMSTDRSNFAVTAAYRLTGALDRDALSAALAALSDRHEALRTRLIAVGGQPRQIVDAPGSGPPLEVADTVEDEAARMQSFFSRPFDLEAGPIWRAKLMGTGSNRHTLLLAVHHIVVDDWSIGLLLEDIGTLYRDFLKGRPPTSVPSLQFADICAARAERPDRAQDIAYWRSRLADLPSSPPLAYDAPGGSDGDYDGEAVTLTIPLDTVAAIRSTAATRGTTPFVWLLAAFEAAIHGLGGARDLTIGTPLAGRTEPAAETVVGYFVNPAVLRTTVPDDTGFAALVDATARTVVEAHGHGETPFENVLEALGRGPAEPPPFHVWFTVLTHSAPRRLDDALALEVIHPENRPARFPLALVLEPDGDGLIGHLEFARRAYRPETVSTLAEAFEAVLALSVNDPETRMSEMTATCAEIRMRRETARAERFQGRQRDRLAAARRPKRARTGTEGTEP